MRTILLIGIVGVVVWILFAFLGNGTDLNLVLISVDTLRPDHLGCYGYPDVRTPALDSLAAEGIRFTDIITPVPLTLPSHATILTGLYPPSHGIRDNAFMSLPQETTTLAETLRGRGYSTCAVLGASVLDSRYGLDQGFDIYDDDLSGGRQPHEFTYTEISADAVTRKAVTHLREIAEPFFAFLHYYDPHTTYDPPEPFATTYRARPYDGEIAYTDQAIGSLIGFLREEDLLERSLVVVLSDHGEGLGQHSEPTHGVLVYQSTLRVPLIIRAPEDSPLREAFAPGSTTDLPVTLADIHDSLLDMVGIAPDGETDGTSFLHRIGREVEEPEIHYFESLYPNIAYRWSALRGIRSGRWKYILAPREELYDLDGDPGEMRNLAHREPERAEAMKEHLVALARSLEKEGVASASRPDQEEIRKLRALGYVSGGAQKVPEVLDTGGADPKEIIAEFAPLMGNGEDALAAGNLETALRSFSRLLELDAGNPQPHVFIARTLMAMGRLDEAEAEYLHVTKIDSANSTPYFHLGHIAQRRGRLEEALAYYERALELVPGSPEAFANMGSILIEKGLPDSAEGLLRRALKGDPQNRVAILNLGLIFSSNGDDDEALRFFRRALKLDPESVKAMANIAAIYAARGLADSTIKYLKAATRVEPANASILSNLGNAYRQKGMSGESERYYDEALRYDPDNVLALFGLAAVRAGQGRIWEAEELLERVLAVEPGFAPARAALEGLSRNRGG